jgi:hypothetical protein
MRPEQTRVAVVPAGGCGTTRATSPPLSDAIPAATAVASRTKTARAIPVLRATVRNFGVRRVREHGRVVEVTRVSRRERRRPRAGGGSSHAVPGAPPSLTRRPDFDHADAVTVQ